MTCVTSFLCIVQSHRIDGFHSRHLEGQHSQWWLVPLSVTTSQVNEWARTAQNPETSSPNHLMGFMMDILSWSRKGTGEISDINDGCFSLMWACSRALVLCTLTHWPGLLWHLLEWNHSLVTLVLVLKMSAVKPINCIELHCVKSHCIESHCIMNGMWLFCIFNASDCWQCIELQSYQPHSNSNLLL